MSVTEEHGPNVNIYCSSVAAPIWDTQIDAIDFSNKKLVVFLLSVSELSSNLAYCSLLLDARERLKADRFFNTVDRNRYILSHAIFKLLAAKYLNKSPLEIEVVEGENKKPTIKGYKDFHFNISHSGNNSIIVFHDEAVGVDIEELNPTFNYSEIIGEVFSNSERESIISAKEPIHLFYNLWTRKEALIKATAKGIDEDFRLFSCLDGHHSLKGHVIGSELNWMIETFNILDKLICSIASPRSATKDTKFFKFSNRYLATLFDLNTN